jgi:hypothetical protein
MSCNGTLGAQPRQAEAGHQQLFTGVVARTFKRRLHSVTDHPIVRDYRSVFGLRSCSAVAPSMTDMGK